ncbi:hypothetical protein PS627_02022 [Pseudomonas fluorescens]|uniref:hypothetical protein n=1 Tax=Pseudomonas fluorescens TaxID=294 RepID=UPI001251DB80|nr:hypothetical protein [Pseudomonas fluorescens]CAG8866625.1 hypothetical protein PS627_02022 [Pseudomonas fluorescens]VVP89761.1 hypothetical protein PS910_02763 [Pseudomonas fluorescens]
MKWNITNFIRPFKTVESGLRLPNSLIFQAFRYLSAMLFTWKLFSAAMAGLQKRTNQSAAGASILMVFWHNRAPFERLR